MRLLLLLVLLLFGCSVPPRQAMCVLIDTSGTYTDQGETIMKHVKLSITPQMRSGDRLVVMAITSNSYGRKNVIAEIQIDSSRHTAATQRREFASTLDAFDSWGSKYTDISGAMMYCSEYLRELRAGRRKILVFSDMKEELPRGVTRNFSESEFEGYDIVVVNMKRLKSDQMSPEQYRQRMTSWGERLEQHGANSYQVYMGPERIQSFVQKR